MDLPVRSGTGLFVDCLRACMKQPMTPHSPAVAKLLQAADDLLAMAREFQKGGRPGDAIACAMFANEYVQAARAIARDVHKGDE